LFEYTDIQNIIGTLFPMACLKFSRKKILVKTTMGILNKSFSEKSLYSKEIDLLILNKYLTNKKTRSDSTGSDSEENV
jgi:hypothetical protein